jgi:hypothetical protein
MADYDDVNTPLVALIGFLSAILVFAVVVALAVLYNAAQEREQYQKNISQPYTALENLLASDRIKLVEYRWVDQKKQTVAIPIERAMALVVAQYRGPKQAASQGGSPAGRGGQK